MAILTKAQLKALWINGYKPTQTDFANLFDSLSSVLNQGSNITLKQETNGSITISASGVTEELAQSYYLMQASQDYSKFLDLLAGGDTAYSELITKGLSSANAFVSGTATPFAEVFGMFLRAQRSIKTLHGTSYKGILFSMGEGASDPYKVESALVWSGSLAKPVKVFTDTGGTALRSDLGETPTAAQIDTFLTTVYNDSRSVEISGGGGGDLSNYYTKAQTDSKISEAANNVEGTLLGQSIPESAADTSVSDIITELYADGRYNYHSGYTSDNDPLAQLLGFVQEAAARLMFLEGSSYKAIVGIKEASTDIICAICWGTNEPTNMFTWASSGEGDVKILPSQRTPAIIDSLITSISTDGNTIPLKDPEILKPTERAQVTTTIVSQSYVAPGETINIVNSATGNFDLYLQDGMDKSVYPYFRDTILDVPADAKPIFSVWNGGVTTQIKKTAEVDSISATSGRKVYAIHWVPTGTSASDRSCVAYINVANYI